MKKTKIIFATSNYLSQLGFRSMIGTKKEMELLGLAGNPLELSEILIHQQVQVLVIDYLSTSFCLDDITVLHENFPYMKILAITDPQSKSIYIKAIQGGVTSHLLKECGEEEIMDAIRSTAKDEPFFCNKVIHILTSDRKQVIQTGISCNGVRLSPREIEILQLISEGLMSKEIADKLFLSGHTISTHRKNIKKKLRIKSTAGLIMLALEQDLIQNRSNAVPSRI